MSCRSDFCNSTWGSWSPRTHPDRLVNATPAEKKAATVRFQVRCMEIGVGKGSQLCNRQLQTHITFCRTALAGRSMISYTQLGAHRKGPQSPMPPRTFSQRSRICSGTQVALALGLLRVLLVQTDQTRSMSSPTSLKRCALTSHEGSLSLLRSRLVASP